MSNAAASVEAVVIPLQYAHLADLAMPRSGRGKSLALAALPPIQLIWRRLHLFHWKKLLHVTGFHLKWELSPTIHTGVDHHAGNHISLDIKHQEHGHQEGEGVQEAAGLMESGQHHHDLEQEHHRQEDPNDQEAQDIHQPAGQRVATDSHDL